ncbi:hypothetical protein WJR50_22505 [Catalinimonas sp. 4WD22]|uniref:hypothetical protein n=1 Tax=Catalinimonas locisalis TaxID=3133978 RepID=UPI003100CEC2
MNQQVCKGESALSPSTFFLKKEDQTNFISLIHWIRDGKYLHKLYLLVFMALSVILGSCEEDEEVAPQQPEPQPTEPVEAKFSGTIKAAPGQTVAGTYVLACFNNDCEDDKSKFVQIEEGQGNATFEIKDLASGKYSLLAWKDNNANMDLDAGDAVGILSSDGEEADLVAPPKADIILEIDVLTDSDGNPVDEGSISGTITAPLQYDVSGAVVIACQWDGEACMESTSQVVEVSAQGTYQFSDLAPEQYFIIAWKDENGNGQVDEGDLYGMHSSNGSTASVLPPSDNINVAMAVVGSQNGPVGSVPGELSGEWINGSASAVDYYNPSTGGWAPPSGSGMYLKLYEDGSFDLSTMLQVTNYNCTSQVTTFYKGTAVFDENDVTLEPSYTRQRYNSNCYSHLNYDKEVPNSPFPFKWRLEDNEGQPALVLVWPDGSESYFSRP